jgi:hypothetical protein
MRADDVSLTPSPALEVTIKELKGGSHLGEMQVTKDADRVTCSVALSVVTYLLLVRLYGHDEALPGS